MNKPNISGRAKKRYLITAAQSDAPVHEEFLAGLERKAKDTGAELLIYEMRSASTKKKSKDQDEEGLDPEDEEPEEDLLEGIRKYLQEVDPETNKVPDRRLNDKIQISDYRLQPQQIDPITGLPRFTQNDATTIIPSPKQRMKVTPNSQVKLPKVIMTTGAITKPNYRDNRRGDIATRDHVFGAIIVEVVDSRYYHYRPIRANKNGHFVDLGVHYHGDERPDTAVLEALVLGDWHCGDTDPSVRKASFDLIEKMKPRRIFLHDLFNGHSINHHEKNSGITLAQEYLKGRLDLAEEVKAVYKELLTFVDIAGRKTEIVVVKSNHDEFLDTWFEDGDYVKDPQNYYFASKLVPSIIEGKNPLVAALSQFGRIPANIRFLERTDEYKLMGYHLGNHGDKGPNGARTFSINSRETAFGRSITAHSHTPEILRDTWIAGTSTKLQLRYNRKGPSGWMNTHVLLYDNGKPQSVNIINGTWHG